MHSNLFSNFPEYANIKLWPENDPRSSGCCNMDSDPCECVLLWDRKQESLDAGHPVFDELWFRLNERIFLLDLGQK